MFYSRAASNLAAVEEQRLNIKRMNLRRLGAVIMLALAVLIAIGAYGYDLERPTASFFVVWMCVIVLLMVVVVLAFIDLRLTVKLREAFRRRREET